ncbi:MAG: PEP/pyruvate-binding domain-containing protein [Desulfosporosinus sp.]|nr:PEP/pyruvate-binding domain-containing protein [Desulfosporosinus sp.]
MSDKKTFPLVLPLNDASVTLEQVGGKGASLARLVAAGLPVPSGFQVTTSAYRCFVNENGLQEKIMAAVATVTADHPDTFDNASRLIESLFANSVMPEGVNRAIRQAYAQLGEGKTAVAVRSSATAEDLPELSFAGQQETYLNMLGEEMVLAAVQRCWASLWTSRAMDYRARHQIPSEDVSLAVVIQELVPADAAGVLFTANPLSGARDQVVINAAWGLGEAIVSGKVNPDTMVVDKISMKIIEQHINQKNVMTVRTPEGTHEEAVPADQRVRAVLSPGQAVELARLGVKIEGLYGQPMDIEWALHTDSMFIVQARPITTLHGHNPAMEEWNDSLGGDYLWTNGNLGEAIPDVMTPCTWSLVQIFMADAMATSSVAPYLGYGNVGGRFYMNLSVAASLAATFGLNRKRFVKLTEEVFGRLPEGLEIPLIPMSRWGVLRKLVPVAIRVMRRVRANQKRLPEFLAAAPEHCETLRARINTTPNAGDLLELWHNEVLPFFHDCCYMLEAAAKQGGSALIFVRRNLRKMVGESDTNTLLTGLSTSANQLASLGPLIGLTQLTHGEIDRATFARRYGHRSPHEFEVSIARPGEGTDWIDQQLAGLKEAKVDITVLLQRQESTRTAAWERLSARYPKQVATVHRQIDRWAMIARNREVARTEVIRIFWVLRAFALRAGELTGQGENIFFLAIGEILALLSGEDASVVIIPARRKAYAHYCALPPYPALILGHFDPSRWAADPERRGDIFDARGTGLAKSQGITGFPGAAGVVEGRARVILTAEEGEQLQPGEILITTVTNVGWTPLFPRAAAVVTDVGAPLSHAAIVARELGIPAVVGCGNATMRLHTGDLVRVNGELGTVEVLQVAGVLP